jgi:hypothetical protein
MVLKSVPRDVQTYATLVGIQINFARKVPHAAHL